MQGWREAVVAAWSAFVRDARARSVPVRDPILESWRRSREAGVDPEVVRFVRVTDEELSSRLHASRALIESSRPHLEWLVASVAPAACVAYVVDADGIVLDSLGDAGFIQEAHLLPGADWSEARMGTNGAGTAIVEGRAIAVVGPEHWCRPWHETTCTGAPIRDAVGRVIGAIDVSTALGVGPTERLPLVSHAAFAIARELAAVRSGRVSTGSMRALGMIELAPEARSAGPHDPAPDPATELEGLRGEVERLRALAAKDRYLLDAVLEFSPHGIIVSDVEGRLVLQNRASERIWAGGPAAGPANGASLEAEEVPFQRFDGTLGTLLGSSAPIYDDNGVLEGSVSAFADISRLKETEAAERRALAEAEAGVRRARVLAVVSHDLRTPLATIQANAASLAKDESDVTQLRADAIVRASKRMARMIDDLLDLASVTAGSLSIRRAPCELDHVVSELSDDFVAYAERRGIALVFDVPPPLSISADPGRLLQVLSNLIANALEATARDGSVTVSVTRADAGTVFVVRDTGRGIEPSELAHVFDPFWRSSSSDYRGTGLGLPIARALVEAHGGTITVESVVGQGTSFRFTLAD